jgi:hypothetical protein
MSSRHFSLYCLVSVPDEEFDVLGEEYLALLRRRFERMYTNWKNARRSSGMCYQCGKHRHFITESPEAMSPSTSTVGGPTTSTGRGMTTRARTSPSGSQKGVVVTRRRSR